MTALKNKWGNPVFQGELPTVIMNTCQEALGMKRWQRFKWTLFYYYCNHLFSSFQALFSLMDSVWKRKIYLLATRPHMRIQKNASATFFLSGCLL